MRRRAGPMRVLQLFGALLASASISGAPAWAAAGEQFGGYQASGSGSGFTAAPVLPAVLPLETPFEGTLSLAMSSLSTGGRGFGRASTVWPGTLAAGVRPLIEIGSGQRVPIPDYPIVVEQKEYEDAKQSEVPGTTMSTDVKPERAVARASDGGFVIPAVIAVGSITTVSEAVLEAKTVTSVVTSTINGVDIGAGILHIDSIESKSIATTDAASATCGGGVMITGASVQGTPVTIDRTGVHAQDRAVIPGAEPTAPAAAVLAASGIEVRTLDSFDGCQGSSASRSTGGLLVSLPLPAVPPLPPGGKFNVVLGSTTAAASASPPYRSEPLGPRSTSPTASQIITRAPGPGIVAAPSPTTAQEQKALPRQDATVAAATKPIGYSFSGVPAQLVLGLSLMALPGARRVRRYMQRLFVAAET